MTRKILVFPCGSEIGLEIHRSMRYSTHFELYGASSIADHGQFVFENYIPGLPFHNEADFGARILAVVKQIGIDAIFPTMDAVAETLLGLGDILPCPVIGSDLRATGICASKSKTYDLLKSVVNTPTRYENLEAAVFPVFIKPDRGYGSRNCLLADGPDQAAGFLGPFERDAMLLLEYLPGEEWTIDCFSDRHGSLRFHGARSRARVSNGISVNTAPSSEFQETFLAWAEGINRALRPRGAWFFQVKADADGLPKLLEVAARLGGSSAVNRCRGVNFALLSAFDALGEDVTIFVNNYPIEMDRALDNCYKVDIDYKKIYVDLDDCLLIRGLVNWKLVGFLYKCVSEGKSITLLTRHFRHPENILKEKRIFELFDKIVHVEQQGGAKSVWIDSVDSIFIDDSFQERQEVFRSLGIPVFSPDMVEALL